MYSDSIRLIPVFIILAVLQVLVFNHIHLFQCATPFIYIYLVVNMRRGNAKWVMLIWAFSMGLLMDTFTNTPGVAAGAMTLAALVQPFLLERVMVREGEENLLPTMNTLGKKQFAYYTLILVAVYTTVFYTLEMFSFFNFLRWLACVVGSTLITAAFILAYESMRRKKE